MISNNHILFSFINYAVFCNSNKLAYLSTLNENVPYESGFDLNEIYDEEDDERNRKSLTCITPKFDIYSLGHLIVDIFKDDLILINENQVIEKECTYKNKEVKDNKSEEDELLSICSQEMVKSNLKELVNLCIVKDSTKRIELNELLVLLNKLKMDLKGHLNLTLLKKSKSDGNIRNYI